MIALTAYLCRAPAAPLGTGVAVQPQRQAQGLLEFDPQVLTSLLAGSQAAQLAAKAGLKNKPQQVLTYLSLFWARDHAFWTLDVQTVVVDDCHHR